MAQSDPAWDGASGSRARPERRTERRPLVMVEAPIQSVAKKVVRVFPTKRHTFLKRVGSRALGRGEISHR